MSDSVKPLANQVAVVTGAGRGIGAAIARQLGQMGASTVLCARNRARLDETARTINQDGHSATALECDVTLLPSVESLARDVEARFGRIDILVNNAGIGGFSLLLHELTPKAWDEILDTNLRGVYYMIRMRSLQ